MAICYGSVVSKKLSSKDKNKEEDIDIFEELSSPLCHLCRKDCAKEETMKCLQKDCSVETHIVCLAKYFLSESNQFVPVSGSCPKCATEVLWGDLVRQKKGCYKNLGEEQDVCSLSDYDIDTPF